MQPGTRAVMANRRLIARRFARVLNSVAVSSGRLLDRIGLALQEQQGLAVVMPQPQLVRLEPRRDDGILHEGRQVGFP
ncbi:hypothetical protein D3C77_330300 [compost metagenome]